MSDARERLALLAYDPHASADNLARRLIDLIDKGDKPAISTALGEIDEQGEERRDDGDGTTRKTH